MGTILIVDDKEINRAVLCATFGKENDIIEVENGQEALEVVMKEYQHISAILLDIVMPVMDGLEFLEQFNRLGFQGKIPVFLITSDTTEVSMCRGFQLGVMDIIEKPIVPYFVKRRVYSVVELFKAREELRQVVKEQHGQIKEKEQEISELNYAIIETLATAIEFRSNESGSHVKRISDLTRQLLLAVRETDNERYQLTDQKIDQIASAAIMHDVGKIGIPDSILNKPARLTKEEFEIMKTHTTKGSDILARIPQYEDNDIYQYAYDICLHHHERWDGRGYPDGLKGDEISIWSQVVSIADVFDALTTERVYKKVFTREEAINMIWNGECGIFNPKLLDVARPILESYDYSE